ncbi:SH3 domain-containing protein [Litchfieldia alkalitelluris]|uniref:SH3 domain-containing protein n=1 Tax=Litchfieldia alkalitelluris TaxID=304268 RepID=UPI0014730BBE|nr:SH3 domain-containing protein [Litchfieldia alkalitelluris]
MLQHIVKIALCIILLTISPLTVTNIVSAESSATINTSVLNVREGPGLSYKVIKQVKSGEKFPIIETKNDWYKVKLSNNLNGWVAAWLVSTSQVKPQPTSSTVVSTVDSLRIRTGPGTSFQVTGYMDKGQEATFIEKNENWSKIQFKNTKGWVSSQYLSAKSTTPSSSTPSDNNSGTVRTGKITANAVNVRSQPNLSGKILGKVNNGDSVTVTNEKESWYEIKFNKTKAWVYRDYVKIQSTNTKPNNNTPSTPEPSTQSGTGIVTASSLNVRENNTLNGAIIGSLKKGDSVTILSESNKWFEVKLTNGKTGWVAGWFIERQAEKPKESPSTSEENIVKILNNGTNIRSGASTTTSVVARANEGDTFKILGTEGDWYKIDLNNGKTGYIAGWIVQVIGDTPTVQKPGVNQYLKDKTIVLDAGHGGRDSGAIGVKGTYEKDLTLRTTKLVFDKLTAAGANVILTRNSDTYVSLASRVSISHYRNADAFVSVHYDSINDSSVRGVTSYYYKNIDVPVASAIQTEMIKYTGLKDRGHRSGNFQVLRSNRQPSALLELGFISNLTEELTVNSSNYQENVSNGIYYGLAQYFKSN